MHLPGCIIIDIPIDSIKNELLNLKFSSNFSNKLF